MATVRPFRALRPRPADAARIAAVPYDVVNVDEARALADGNPLSFLRVSRAEIELPGIDPYADAVYERAAENFRRLRDAALVVEEQPSLYCYGLTMNGREQTGVAGCFSLDEYDRDIIRKHERTRRDKEDDRTRHMLALAAQTGPVFLTYKASQAVNAAVDTATRESPVVDFEAPDGVRHTIWRMPRSACEAAATAFGEIPALYIADGHHRAASAARARDHLRSCATPRRILERDADYSHVLAVAFPHDQVHILPYNRIVKDLGELSTDAFLQAVRQRFDVGRGSPAPRQRGEFSMYLRGEWYGLGPRQRPVSADPIGSLDVSVLQEELLAPILNIADVRTDKRIDFVGGVRGTRELEACVDSGRAAVAFSLYPVSVADLMTVADSGGIMPPKSTWFEPKLRDGLLIHLI